MKWLWGKGNFDSSYNVRSFVRAGQCVYFRCVLRTDKAWINTLVQRHGNYSTAQKDWSNLKAHIQRENTFRCCAISEIRCWKQVLCLAVPHFFHLQCATCNKSIGWMGFWLRDVNFTDILKGIIITICHTWVLNLTKYFRIIMLTC